MCSDRPSKAKILICAFIIPFVMSGIFWALCRMYPFGPSSILTGDMNVEFVNFYAYFINTLHTDNDWSYMLTKTLGGDFPGLAAFQLHDPLLFILLLFPGEKIIAGIELIFSIQISIAGLCTAVLLNNRYRTSWVSLLFSTGYAFCSFFFGYLVLTIYFGAIAILPLVLYFFLEFIDKKERLIPFILSAAALIYINYHMGFMLVIFLVILYISRIIADAGAAKRLGLLALSGITVLLIDGFFLLRTGLSLIGEKTTTGADYGVYRRFPMNEVFAGLFAACSRNDLRPLIYCSVAAFFFAVVYFISPHAGRREKLANLFVLAAVVISMWINVLDAVWHGFNNPEGFYWRYAYYVSIILVVLGYKGFLSLLDESGGERRIRTVAVSSGIIILYMVWLRIRQNPYLDTKRFIINLLIVAVISAASFAMVKGGRIRIAAFVLLFLLTLPEMLYNAKTAYFCLNSEDGQFPKAADFFEEYREIGGAVSDIKQEDKGFYRIEKDFDRGINDPSMFDYVGLSHDSSCEKDEILDWLVNFGFCKTVYFTYYNGGSTSFVDNLFGIRYYISRFDSVEKPYEKIPRSGKYYVYRNDNALPMAYIAPEGLADLDLSSGSTFEKQNRIASFWIGEPVLIGADYSVSTDGAKESGKGHYERTADEGYIVYDIRVTSEEPLYFYFYAPGRQDGEVYVNGESRDVYFTVNHWNTLCAGRYSIGDTLEIRMKILGDSLDIDEACFFYEDASALSNWSEAAAKLNGSIGDVEKIKSSHFRFTTDTDSDRTVIVSVPYEPAWTVTCDGTRLETRRAMGMLESFTVPEGEHVIEMRYTPAGTAAGIALTTAGILLFVILFFTREGSPFQEKLLKRSKISKIRK
ncbi:MAG: YfhO family protein [Lachnospiraceae bacterium]|nr:YfhO family protein [Lachnospiraceae bacterium]